MKKSRVFYIRTFRCPDCGNNTFASKSKGITGNGHIKNLYCPWCKQEKSMEQAIAWGYKSKAKGVLGSYLVFADWEGNESEYHKPDTWTLKGAQMAQVDGEKIKPDTWYVIKNGEIVEDEEENDA